MAQALGVPQLDRILEPVPHGATLLFLNDPGVEAEPFLYQVASGALQQGRDVVYLVTNRAPASVRKAMDEYGLATQGPGAKLAFVDAYSALMGSWGDDAHVVMRPQDPREVARALEAAAARHPGAVLVVDALSALADHSSEAFAAAAPALLAAMRRFSLTAALFTRWGHPPEAMQALEAFDGLVTVRAVEDRVVLSQYFRLERAAWKQSIDAKPRLYKSVKPGGVLVYIPKIVVTGPFNAGKSSFVHAVSDAAVSVDHLGTTVALDHGRVTMDGLTADVFGTPGQARFDPILRIVAGQAVGVIVVVDSSKPDSFPRAREMMQLTWRQGLPGIVAATKQDLPDALAPE
ncbi:MAG TPA: ATPase domain-containing protein, partial [Candidatus Thermoplasmatota archaeon]|nr:ATPase domain-containing protein [Candidatus Thermoplasmatota archaeon]